MEWRRRQDEGALDRFVRIGRSVAARVVPSLREKRRLERMVGPVGMWDELQAYQIGCLRALGLKPLHHVLDIGCGPLQGGIAFLKYLDAGCYAGVDVSEEAIAEGRRLISKSGLTVRRAELHVSFSFGKDELGDRKFDYIWASQILYHLSDDQLDALFAEVARRLNQGGRFVGDAKIAEGDEAWLTDHDWSGYKFHYRPLSSYAEVAARHGLELQSRGPIKDHGYPTRWTYSLGENVLLELTLS